MSNKLVNIGGIDVLVAEGAEFALMAAGLDEIPILPKEPLQKDSNVSKEFERWGEGNNLPELVLDAVKRSTIIASTIGWKVRQMTSGGLIWGTVTGYSTKGEEIFEPEYTDDLLLFLENHDNLIDYYEEALSDLYWWNMIFPEVGLNDDRSKIVTLFINEASNCRFEKRDKSTTNIEHVFVDKNWPSGTKDTWRKVKHIEKYFAVADRIKFDPKKNKQYIISNSFASPKCDYYQKAPWHNLIDSQWLEIAASIADFKAYLLKNQMTLKYLVHVPLSWWKWKYPDFETMKADERRTVMADEHDKFNKLLAGSEHTGKSLFLTFNDITHVNKEYSQWKVITLNGTKELSDQFVQDSQEASSHGLYALATDVTLIGALPGKGMGAGSGSDKREALNIFVLNNIAVQRKALQPLRIIAQYNNWRGKNGKLLEPRPNNFLLNTTSFGENQTTPVQKGGEVE